MHIPQVHIHGVLFSNQRSPAGQVLADGKQAIGIWPLPLPALAAVDLLPPLSLETLYQADPLHILFPWLVMTVSTSPPSPNPAPTSQ